MFADVYHSLIHSPLSETLLQLEAAYASSVEAVCRERDLRLADMEARHTKEMAEAVTAAGWDIHAITLTQKIVRKKVK